MADNEEELIGGEDLDYEEYDLDEEEEEALLADQTHEKIAIAKRSHNIESIEEEIINEEEHDDKEHYEDIYRENEETFFKDEDLHSLTENAHTSEDISTSSGIDRSQDDDDEEEDDDKNRRNRDRFKSERRTISLHNNSSKQTNIPDSLDEVKVTKSNEKKKKNKKKKGSVHSRLNGIPLSGMNQQIMPPIDMMGPGFGPGPGPRGPSPPWMMGMRLGPNNPMMRPGMRMMGPPMGPPHMRMNRPPMPMAMQPMPTRGQFSMASPRPSPPVMDRLGPPVLQKKKPWSRGVLPNKETAAKLDKIMASIEKQRALPVKVLGNLPQSLKRQNSDNEQSPPTAKVMKNNNAQKIPASKTGVFNRLNNQAQPNENVFNAPASNPNLKTITVVSSTTSENDPNLQNKEEDYGKKLAEQKRLRDEIMAKKEARRKVVAASTNKNTENHHQRYQNKNEHQYQPPHHQQQNSGNVQHISYGETSTQWAEPHYTAPPPAVHAPPHSHTTYVRPPPPAIHSTPPVYNSHPPPVINVAGPPPVLYKPPEVRPYYNPAIPPTAPPGIPPPVLPNTQLPPPSIIPQTALPPPSINTNVPPPPIKFNTSAPPPVVSSYNQYVDPNQQVQYGQTWDNQAKPQPATSYQSYEAPGYEYVGQEDYYQNATTQYTDYNTQVYTNEAQDYSNEYYQAANTSTYTDPSPVVRVLSTPRKVVKTPTVRYTTTQNNYEKPESNEWPIPTVNPNVSGNTQAPTVTKKFFRRIIKRNKKGEVFSIRKVPVDADGNEIGEAIIEYQQPKDTTAATTSPVKRTNERVVLASGKPEDAVGGSHSQQTSESTSPYKYSNPHYCTVQLYDLPALKKNDVRRLISSTVAEHPLDFDYDERTRECFVRYENPDMAAKLHQKMNRRMVNMSFVRAKLLP